MAQHPIKHVWFDMDGTLGVHTPEYDKAHNKLRYATYSEVVKKPVTTELIEEYEAIYKREGTNSAVFRSLGLPSHYWMDRFDKLDKSLYYRPIPAVYGTLEKLKDIVPISLFTNDSVMGTEKTLKVIAVEKEWFTHIITGDMVKERKPNLEGYNLVITKTEIPENDILYVGDRVKADVLPARAVGMQTCLVWSKSEEADYSFEKFEDLLSLF